MIIRNKLIFEINRIQACNKILVRSSQKPAVSPARLSKPKPVRKSTANLSNQKPLAPPKPDVKRPSIAEANVQAKPKKSRSVATPSTKKNDNLTATPNITTPASSSSVKIVHQHQPSTSSLVQFFLLILTTEK